MRSHRDEDKMRQILELITMIDSTMGNPEGRERFNKDKLIQFGVSLALHRITNLMSLLSFDIKQRMPEIPWQKMDDLRDYLDETLPGANPSRANEPFASEGVSFSLRSHLKSS